MTISPMLIFCVLMWCILYSHNMQGAENALQKWGGSGFGDENHQPSIGGSGGMLPKEGLEFLTPRECFWGFLTVVLSFFLLCISHHQFIPIYLPMIWVSSLSSHSLCISIGNHTHSSPIWEIIVLSSFKNCTRQSRVWFLKIAYTTIIFQIGREY